MEGKSMTTNNPELDAAWAAESHLGNVRAARESLMEARKAMVAPQGVAGLRAEITELVLSGESVPPDLVDRVGEAMAAETAFNRAGMLLTEVSQGVGDVERQMRARAAHAGLRYLHGRVEEIVDAAREAAAVLGGADSAEAALRAGGPQTDAWRSLVDLSDQYRNVRDAQRVMLLALQAVTSDIPGVGAETLAVIGEIREYRTLWPAWRDKTGRSSVSGAVVNPAQFPPWPHEKDGSPTRDPAFLLWAAGFEENPLWVPSVAEMNQARSQRHNIDEETNEGSRKVFVRVPQDRSQLTR
jgi:hypothetical protein